MINASPPKEPRPRAWALRAWLVIALSVGALLLFSKNHPSGLAERTGMASSTQSKPAAGAFRPTAAQWAGLTIEPIGLHPFRSELVTDGKIAVDQNRSTPIFSPYSGRVTRLAAEPGDVIQRGQLLFALEATDMVQAQNDFITAIAGLETARSTAQARTDQGEAAIRSL
jgi:membrane fusion protein, heavy metal efflux system